MHDIIRVYRSIMHIPGCLATILGEYRYYNRLNSSFKTVDEWCLYIYLQPVVLKISASDILNYDDV